MKMKKQKKRKKLKLEDNSNLPLFLNYILYHNFTKIDEVEEGKKFFTKNEEMNHNNYYYAADSPISSLIDLSVLKENQE